MVFWIITWIWVRPRSRDAVNTTCSQDNTDIVDVLWHFLLLMLTTVCVQASAPFEPPPCRELIARDADKTLRATLDRPPPRPHPRRSDRKYRPWSWEMHGARFWPWLTIERHIGEELRLRHDRKMPHRRPLWPPDDLVRGRPTVFALEPYRPVCAVPVRETCVTERPLVCQRQPPSSYMNFVNWQWLPHSLSTLSPSPHTISLNTPTV